MVLQFLWESMSSPSFIKTPANNRGFFLLPLYYLCLSFLSNMTPSYPKPSSFLPFSLTSSFFILISSFLLAQPQLSPRDSTKIFYSFLNTDSTPAQYSYPLDTVLDNIHYYDPAQKNFNACSSQGNIGRAVHNLIPSFESAKGFDVGIHSFDLYKYDPDLIKLYRQYYPFTRLHYVMGGKKEQFLEVVHSQNLGKLFSLTANLRIINSPGSYQHQKSDISNLIVTGQYFSRNNRYQANLNLCQNILKIQENGGIINDSVFENNQEPDRRVISVMLNEAQNRIRETSLVAGQKYCLFKDSMLTSAKWLTYFPRQLVHSLRYTECSYVYEEPGTATDFYPFPPLDSSITQDELLYKQLNNKLLLTNLDQRPLQYAVGLKHERIFIRDERNESRYSQFSALFDAKIGLPWHLNFRIHAEKYYGGYNEGDYNYEMRISKQFSVKNHSSGTISLWNRTSETHPSWIQSHYHSNLMNWEKSFNSVYINTLGVEIHYKTFEAGFRQHSMKDFIINDKYTSIPAQLTDKVNVMQFYIQLRLKLWKIVLDNRYDYQKVDKIQYLHIPQYITRHSVYFDFNLFNKALILQPGLSFYWQSAYYADAYMPPTLSYYLQSTTKINDQFFADAFINLKVGRARIFLKYQHFNSAFGPYNYYLVPHYPVQDAAIRFGVCWLMRDLPDKDKKFEVTEK